MPLDFPNGLAGNIADLQTQIGQTQARGIATRGNLIGGYLANIANVIGQAPERQMQQQQMAAQTAEMQARQQDRQAQADERTQRATATAQRQSQLAQIYNDPSVRDDSGNIDFDKLSQAVATVDPETASHLSSLAKSHTDIMQSAQKQREAGLDRAATLLSDAKTPSQLQAAAMLLPTLGLAEKDAKQIGDIVDQGPDAISAFVNTYSSTARAAKAKAAEAAAAPPKTREITTVGADGKPVIQIVEDKPGQSFATLPKETPPKSLDQQIADAAKNNDVAETRRLLKVKRDIALAGHIVDSSNEPLVPIMGPDGKSVLVRRSAAEGKQPANSREQGRAVTSGDANKLGDLTNSLSQLQDLRNTISGVKGATGASAQIGAALPAMVTSLTGWGTEAKQKQAVIDRVKQVIGKSLEGGVLRKEDEIKYAKILPTIADTQEVVQTKLDGLDSALKQKRSDELSALADAGYDTSRFESRVGGQAIPATGKTKIGRFEVEVR